MCRVAVREVFMHSAFQSIKKKAFQRTIKESPLGLGGIAILVLEINAILLLKVVCSIRVFQSFSLIWFCTRLLTSVVYLWEFLDMVTETTIIPKAIIYFRQYTYHLLKYRDTAQR